MDAPGLRRPTLRIGLTGGIGSGKSTVARLLAQHGACIVDTDLIARQLTLPAGAAIGPIAAEFGANFIDASGALDRSAMRDLVFSDADAKLRLEAILHPLIGAETERQASLATGPAVVFDVPLLVESIRWRDKVGKILVVDCLEATQVDRVMARSGWTLEAVTAVIAQQATRAQRRAAADAIIYNDGVTLERLGNEVEHLWRYWTRTPD